MRRTLEQLAGGTSPAAEELHQGVCGERPKGTL
jgi:hypothetical protein